MSELDLPGWAMLAPVALWLLATGASILLISAGRRLQGAASASLLALGSLAGLGVAIDALLDRSTRMLAGWQITPFAEVSFRLDPLAAFFLLVISLPSLAAAVYSVGYLDAGHGGHGPEPRAAPVGRKSLES